MSENLQNCPCTTQQFGQFIFNTVAYQNGANMVYQNQASTITASVNGTRTQNIGAPIFKDNAERMAFLLGKQNQAGCGVRPKKFALGTN
jgi:hypothetical protein